MVLYNGKILKTTDTFMNNTQNNNRQSGERRPPVRPKNNVQTPPPRRPDVPSERHPMRSVRQNGIQGTRAEQPTLNRRPSPSVKRGSSLSRVVLIWVALLAVLLIIIMIIAGTGKAPDDTPFVAGTNGETHRTTTTGSEETTTTYPVNHADYSDTTKTFAGDLSFTNGILIDIENNEVVASRDGDARIYPASMTKVMTLIVAAEAVENLDETFTMTAEITDPLYLANASVAGFLVGEQVTVRDLIYGLILPSGGDGALGLAYHIAGSEEAFAEMMNDKAEELGLRNTHFTNCTGLHGDDHYSTCHEIALIVEYAIKDPFMREVLTTYQYTTEATPEHPDGILLTSTLLSRMAGDESETMFVQGGKTGYTTEAKNCLASFATPLISGMSEDELKLQPTKYILVTAGSGDKFGPVFDAINVYKNFYESDGSTEDTADTSVTVSPPNDTDKTEQTDKTDKTDKTDDIEETTSGENNSVKIYTAKLP